MRRRNYDDYTHSLLPRRGSWGISLERRDLLLAAASFLVGGRSSAQDAPELPVTGRHSGLRSFDEMVLSFIRENRFAGGALAMVAHGRLVHARGYGYSDPDAKRPWQPDALFRIGSVSKPITALAVLRLVQQRHLSLDAPTLPMLGLEPFLKRGAIPDPRLRSITIRQFLNHSSGFDPAGFDGWQQERIAKEMGLPTPLSAEAVVRYRLGLPLDFEPGSRFVYCNENYSLLGTLITKVTKEPYEAAVRRLVLTPAGAGGMRLARSRLALRQPGEVAYCPGNRTLYTSQYPEDQGRKVLNVYGGLCIETAEGAGAWLGSVVDLARLMAGVSGTRGPRLLEERTVAEMVRHPGAPAPEDGYFGLGWNVGKDRDSGNIALTHGGSSPGCCCFVARRFDGVIFAAGFNGDRENGAINAAWDLYPKLGDLANRQRTWPTTDLFASRSVAMP